MSKKRLLHGMKRPLALFLALALALVPMFVAAPAANAAATETKVNAPNEPLTGVIATQNISDYDFVDGQWWASATSLVSVADINKATSVAWEAIKGGATTSFELNYTATATSINSTLAFKVEAPANSKAKLLIYDKSDNSYVGGIWDVLNNKNFPSSGSDLFGALKADYDGYWGPVAGRSLQSGFEGYMTADDYTYYFFADRAGRYTITADLLDISYGAASSGIPLASATVTIEVQPVAITLTPAVGATAITVPSEVTGIKTAGSNDGNGKQVYSVNNNQIESVRAAGGSAVTLEYASNDLITDAKNASYPRTIVKVKEGVANGAADLDEAYLLAYDGTNTFELIKTGFMGESTGQPIGNFATVTSLTFFATEDGTYVIDLELVDLDNNEEVLAEGSLTVIVAAAEPVTSANVATAAELKAAIDTNKTTINVTTSFPTTENVTIPVGTTLNIATSTSLTVANSNTLTMYGTLALAENATVTIEGTLVLSADALNNLSAGQGAKFHFQGGTLKLVSNPESTLRLAGLFADADFDLGLYAGAVLSLSDYDNTSFDELLLRSYGAGMINIGTGVCGVVDRDATLASGLTLDVQSGGALQVESDKTLTADGDIVISGAAKADISGGLTVNGDLTVSGSLTVASDADLTVNGTLEVSGKVTAESGAKVSLQSNITIAAGGSLDLSNVTDSNMTIGNITIILAPGAELSVPATGDYSNLTVMDEDNNVINSENGKYSVPEVPEYELTITSATGVGLGVSFKINVSAGSDSNDLYLIVQSTDEAVSLTMIAVGDYIAAGSGYTTHVSYNKTNQVDAWLVKSPTSGVVPDWTAVDTDGCLADDTYTATTP